MSYCEPCCCDPCDICCCDPCCCYDPCDPCDPCKKTCCYICKCDPCCCVKTYCDPCCSSYCYVCKCDPCCCVKTYCDPCCRYPSCCTCRYCCVPTCCSVKEKYGLLEYPKYFLPKEYDYLLCDNRKSFDVKGEEVMSHGGITIDEVVVPFIKIKAVENNG